MQPSPAAPDSCLSEADAPNPACPAAHAAHEDFMTLVDAARRRIERRIERRIMERNCRPRSAMSAHF